MSNEIKISETFLTLYFISWSGETWQVVRKFDILIFH